MQNFSKYNIQLTICEKLRDIKNVKKAPISAVLERIKNPEQKIIDLQAKFRDTGDPKYRMQLPAFIASGIFTERKSSGFEFASGLMMLDFDKFPDTETLQRERNNLIDCPFVLAVFISPSGEGVKAIIKIRDWKDQDEYRRTFMEAEEYFDSKYFDPSTSDIARLAFFAYDPEIYINWNAEVFDPERPLDRDMDTFGNRISNPIKNEKKSFIVGNRNNYVFELSCDYRRAGVEKKRCIRSDFGKNNAFF